MDSEDLVEMVKLKPEHLSAIETAQATAAAARSRRRRITAPFVIAEIKPLKAAADALAGLGCRALMVWLYLAFETKRRGTNTVHVSNVALAEWGVIRSIKYRALQRLEAAGLITVHKRGKRSLQATVLPGISDR
jgi:hypothetical protein